MPNDRDDVNPTGRSAPAEDAAAARSIVFHNGRVWSADTAEADTLVVSAGRIVAVGGEEVRAAAGRDAGGPARGVAPHQGPQRLRRLGDRRHPATRLSR